MGLDALCVCGGVTFSLTSHSALHNRNTAPVSLAGLLEISTVERGVVSLFGVKSALFVAMNSKGKLYATVSPSGQGKLPAARGLPARSVAQSCPAGSSVRGTLQAGLGCHFLLQGIFQTRGLNLHLLY